jgi:hypothetical protein
MDSDPDSLARLIEALPRKQQLDLIVAVLSRIALNIESIPLRGSAPIPGPFADLPSSPERLREGLTPLTAPDAALVAALAFVAAHGSPDVQFGTEELNEVIGNGRDARLNVQALNPLCVDYYLTAVASASGGRKRFRLTALGLEKAKVVARGVFGSDS